MSQPLAQCQSLVDQLVASIKDTKVMSSFVLQETAGFNKDVEV